MDLPAEFLNSFTCGDCFEIMRDMPDECVDLVLTDPPYGIDYQSNRRVARPKLPKFENDVDVSWVGEWVDQVHRVLRSDRHFYCFTRFDMYPHFYQEISRRFKVKNCLIWRKNNHGSGDLYGAYAPQNEMIIFAAKGRRELNGRRHPDVLDCDNVPSSYRFHATQKPVHLLRFLVEKSTNPGEIVLDPFAGSGSTGLACIDTVPTQGADKRRKYVLIELNPEYVAAALRGALGAQEELLPVNRLPQQQRPRETPAMHLNKPDTVKRKPRRKESLPLFQS